MLKIKLARRGKKNQPHFRLIVLEHWKDTFGDFLEDLGFYNPRSKEYGLKIDRIKYWLFKGAQPTPTVHNLLVKAGVIKGPKIKKIGRKRKKQEKEEKTKEESIQKEKQELKEANKKEEQVSEKEEKLKPESKEEKEEQRKI